MSFGRYALLVLGVVVASVGALSAVLHGDVRAASVLGVALAAANTVAAYALVLWSAPRRTVVFMRAVLGGMGTRMAVMLVAVVVAVRGLGLPAGPLVASLLGYFVLFLVFELVVLDRNARRGAQVGGP